MIVTHLITALMKQHAQIFAFTQFIHHWRVQCCNEEHSSPCGVEVIEIERKADGTDADGRPNYISATKIRAAIQEDRLASLINFLPPCTREYLFSPDFEAVRARIKREHKT